MSSEAMTPLQDESCSLCITSPPYLNNFDFAEMTRMELYFWRYAGSWNEITERVRRRLIVNTTTAPTDLKRDQNRFSECLSKGFRSRLQHLIKPLKEQQRFRAGISNAKSEALLPRSRTASVCSPKEPFC